MATDEKEHALLTLLRRAKDTVTITGLCDTNNVQRKAEAAAGQIGEAFVFANALIAELATTHAAADKYATLARQHEENVLRLTAELKEADAALKVVGAEVEALEAQLEGERENAAVLIDNTRKANAELREAQARIAELEKPCECVPGEHHVAAVEEGTPHVMVRFRDAVSVPFQYSPDDARRFAVSLFRAAEEIDGDKVSEQFASLAAMEAAMPFEWRTCGKPFVFTGTTRVASMAVGEGWDEEKAASFIATLRNSCVPMLGSIAVLQHERDDARRERQEAENARDNAHDLAESRKEDVGRLDKALRESIADLQKINHERDELSTWRHALRAACRVPADGDPLWEVQTAMAVLEPNDGETLNVAVRRLRRERDDFKERSGALADEARASIEAWRDRINEVCRATVGRSALWEVHDAMGALAPKDLESLSQAARRVVADIAELQSARERAEDAHRRVMHERDKARKSLSKQLAYWEEIERALEWIPGEPMADVIRRIRREHGEIAQAADDCIAMLSAPRPWSGGHPLVDVTPNSSSDTRIDLRDLARRIIKQFDDWHAVEPCRGELATLRADVAAFRKQMGDTYCDPLEKLGERFGKQLAEWQRLCDQLWGTLRTEQADQMRLVDERREICGALNLTIDAPIKVVLRDIEQMREALKVRTKADNDPPHLRAEERLRINAGRFRVRLAPWGDYLSVGRVALSSSREVKGKAARWLTRPLAVGRVLGRVIALHTDIPQ